MPYTSLVVDDEPLARELLRALLARDPECAGVLEAANGAEAVERIRADRPGLVFLDVQMPVLDGLGVVQAIGAEVTEVSVGDRVAYAAIPPGAYAEVRRIPAHRLVKLPADISARQAAAMMLHVGAWIAVFNPDPDAVATYELVVSVKQPRQAAPARSIFSRPVGGGPAR